LKMDGSTGGSSGSRDKKYNSHKLKIEWPSYKFTQDQEKKIQT
jgi:hypothetical protein